MVWRYQVKTCLGGEIILRGTRINWELESWWHYRGGGGCLKIKSE